MKTQNFLLMFVLTLTSSFAFGNPVMGTGDSGGGNTYLGRPLESYIVKPKTFPVYRSVIEGRKDVLKNVKYVQEIFGYALGMKTWYLVPGPLKKLPEQVIGSAVTVEQAALQDFDSVWLDRDLFAAMSEKDQARLIVHETLMALRLLRFDKRVGACIMDGVAGFCTSRKYTGRPSDLRAGDYGDIRLVTEQIMGFAAEQPRWDVNYLLHRYGFSTNDLNFDIGNYDGEISTDDLLSLLEESRLQGHWPKHRYNTLELFAKHPDLADGSPVTAPVVWTPSACEISAFEKVGDAIKTTLSWTGADGVSGRQEFVFHPFWQTNSGRNSISEQFHEGRAVQKVSFMSSQWVGAATPAHGEVFYGLEIYLHNEAVFEIQIDKMIAARLHNGGTSSRSVESTTCSVLSKKVLQP